MVSLTVFLAISEYFLLRSIPIKSLSVFIAASAVVPLPIKDKNCKCGYINETDLIKQLQNITDKLDLKTTPMQDKIKAEIRRFKKFQNMVAGKSDIININDVDIQNYAKFILKEGEDQEKRDLLSCLKGEIVLENKKVCLT